MKLSNYTIAIPIQDSKYLILHGYTGAADLITSELYNAMMGSGTINSDIYDRLIKRGYLTDKTKEEEYRYAQRISKVLAARNAQLKKSFSFIVSYACNFKCPYCFEAGRLNNSTHKSLTSDVVDSMYDALLQIEPNKTLHSDIITLFGGEPLLSANKSIVNEIIRKGSQLGYRFTATTNGYDLDKFTDLFGEDKLFGLQITIDGAEKLHDSRRCHNSGKGSFRKIISNIHIALKFGVKVKVRVNVDSANADDIENLLEELKFQGILNHKNFGLYAEHISGEGHFCPEGYEADETSLSVTGFIEKITKFKQTIPFDLQLFSNLKNTLLNGRPLSLSSHHCGANFGNYILDPDGSIYACYDFVGSDKQVIGRYIPTLEWNADNKEYWHKRQIDNIDKCSKCKFAFICGGGCQAKAINAVQPSCCDNFETRLTAIAQHILRTQSSKTHYL